MAVKYHCRKCGKRFVEWGAQKLNFKCPDCKDEELVRVGLSEGKAVKRPAAKRRVRRALPVVHATEEEVLAPDVEDIEAEEVEVEEVEPGTVFIAADDEAAQVGLDLEEVLPAEDIAETEGEDLAIADDLAFKDASTPIAEDALDKAPADEDWPE